MKRASLAAVAVALLAASASAETQSQVVWSQKAWEVRAVIFEEGNLACVARVAEGGDSFSLWSDEQQLIKLEFRSDDWTFGEGDTANLQVEIDNMDPWSISGAELLNSSVFFDLPDSDTSVRFMKEVAAGDWLHLRNSDGEDVISYSLAGSRGSIGALIDCVGALTEVRSSSGNPFN